MHFMNRHKDILLYEHLEKLSKKILRMKKSPRTPRSWQAYDTAGKKKKHGNPSFWAGLGRMRGCNRQITFANAYPRWKGNDKMAAGASISPPSPTRRRRQSIDLAAVRPRPQRLGQRCSLLLFRRAVSPPTSVARATSPPASFPATTGS